LPRYLIVLYCYCIFGVMRGYGLGGDWGVLSFRLLSPQPHHHKTRPSQDQDPEKTKLGSGYITKPNPTRGGDTLTQLQVWGLNLFLSSDQYGVWTRGG
jgi:hypothetical protein